METTFPLGKLTLILRGDERGYAIFLSDGKEVVHAMNIQAKDRSICGEQFQIYEGSLLYDRAGHATTIELPAPGDEEDPVIQLTDGSLFCTKCKCRVVNTANSEMRKEGFFAHSHVCE